MKLSSIPAYLAMMIAATTSGCGTDGASDPALASIDVTLASVGEAVSACKAERERCAAATGANPESCRAAFAACKDDALDEKMPHLNGSVSACAEASRTCRDGAENGDDRRACQEELKACVAETVGSDRQKDAARPDHDRAPVTACTTALRGCIESDQEAKACTDQLRTCLSETLPNHAQGHDRDGGSPSKSDHANDGHGADHAAVMACNEARKACSVAGTSSRECALAAKTCRTTP